MAPVMFFKYQTIDKYKYFETVALKQYTSNAQLLVTVKCNFATFRNTAKLF